MKNRSMKEKQHVSPDRKDAPTTEAYLTRLHSQEPTLMSQKRETQVYYTMENSVQVGKFVEPKPRMSSPSYDL